MSTTVSPVAARRAKWDEPAYRTNKRPTVECPEADPEQAHCAHPTGRFTTDGTGRGEGVAEVQCCWCGERADLTYTTVSLPPSGHGDKHPSHESVVKYDRRAGWHVPEPR